MSVVLRLVVVLRAWVLSDWLTWWVTLARVPFGLYLLKWSVLCVISVRMYLAYCIGEHNRWASVLWTVVGLLRSVVLVPRIIGTDGVR